MKLEGAIQLSSVVIRQRFEGEDLTEFSIFEVRFKGCSFKKCMFDSIRFGASEFINCRFIDCSFRNADFNGCTFSDVEAGIGSVWTLCDLSDARFLKCNLDVNRNTKSKGHALAIIECSAIGIILDMEVHRRIISRTVIGGIHCAASRMESAILRQGDWEERKFEHCDLRKADFSHSRLVGASFSNSSLNNARFHDAVMNETTIAHATIEGFDFAVLRSYDDLVVSRDQHDAILRSFSIRTVG